MRSFLEFRPCSRKAGRVSWCYFVTAVGVFASCVGCNHGSSGGAAPVDSGMPTAAVSAAIRTSDAGPMNALPIAAASVAYVVNQSNLPAYDGPTGSVEGTILVKGPASPDVPSLDVRPCPAALDTYGKVFREGPARADGTRPLGDAVVAVTGYEGYFVPEKQEAQRIAISAGCGYPTRTIATTFGQRLEFVNDSKLPFAPYLEDAFEPAVMIAPPDRNGEPVKMYPPQAGYFTLKDRLQPFVRGDVYVMRQPLHAVSNVAGYYRIDGVPVGKLKVGARLAELNPPGNEAQQDVEVRPNVVQKVDIVLTYTPAAPRDAGAPRAATDGGRPPVIIH
jgi:hypothetical protein